MNVNPARRIREGATMMALLALAGCKLGPNFSAPTPQVPISWDLRGQQNLKGQPISNAEWWKSFGDPKLASLVEQAISQNYDLHSAALRIVQARTGRSARAELLFPVVTGAGSITHLDRSTNVKPEVDVTVPDLTVNVPPALQALGSKIPPILEVSGRPSVDVSPAIDIYSVGFDAIWELDIWGEKRRGIESAAAAEEAAFASYDGMLVSLAGEVAATYIQIRTIQNRLEIARKNVAVMRDFQALAEEKFAKKESPETDVQLARTLAAIVGVSVPKLENALRQSGNSLCLLLGKAPYDVRAEIGASGPIPLLQDLIPVGVPADLLRRRPDIRMAEYLAHSECATIGRMKAKILPTFSLFGMLGWQASDSEKLFDSNSFTDAYGGSVNINGLLFYPFNVERVRMADARFQEALSQYQSTVLAAVGEAENAISALRGAQEELPILKAGSEAAARSAELAVGAYKAGKVIVSVPLVALTFQANLQDQEIAAVGAIATQGVAVYKAMGGGWEPRVERDLVPEEIREAMKARSDWWSFFGKRDLNTRQQDSKSEGK